ncbi:helix-turn-helix transcriptional regulator [Bdellovibrionales bacterium]|nr:helix-turn-helix transcriptional regulator [Bdellovibrionales bacterium]
MRGELLLCKHKDQEDQVMMLKEYLIRKGLSYRESEVAELVSQGLANAAVAEKLFVTEKTIKFHLTNIYRKLNLKSRAQLIIWCRPAQVFQVSSPIDPNAPHLNSGFGTVAGNLAQGVSPVGAATQPINHGMDGSTGNVEFSTETDYGINKKEA